MTTIKPKIKFLDCTVRTENSCDPLSRSRKNIDKQVKLKRRENRKGAIRRTHGLKWPTGSGHNLRSRNMFNFRGLTLPNSQIGRVPPRMARENEDAVKLPDSVDSTFMTRASV
ncbi:hypothetical protein NC652_013651 [Populus alba x Populus x berolinensis]|nr:hypothetical protein NC652_013651 [Populus alba x Populus x berolinensis]